VRRLPNGAREYRFNGARVPIDDVVHVPYISMPGSLTGLNPIEYLRNTFGLAGRGPVRRRVLQELGAAGRGAAR
jgi:hypothetical protein